LDPGRIFSGSASQRLTQAICDRLKVPVGDVVVSRFEDGEVLGPLQREHPRQ
jgi:phosphoribosylpyrophosphate synthetase